MLHIASSLQGSLGGVRTRPSFAFHYACAPFEHARALLSITSGPIQTCSRLTFDHAYSLLEHTLAPLSTTPALCCKTGAQARVRRRTPSHRSRSLPSYVSELRATRRKTAPPRKMATRRKTAPHPKTATHPKTAPHPIQALPHSPPHPAIQAWKTSCNCMLPLYVITNFRYWEALGNFLE